ncbi:MAG: hypothetical protein ACOH5I_23270 [Oligoflexus sp.]
MQHAAIFATVPTDTGQEAATAPKFAAQLVPPDAAAAAVQFAGSKADPA